LCTIQPRTSIRIQITAKGLANDREKTVHSLETQNTRPKKRHGDGKMMTEGEDLVSKCTPKDSRLLDVNPSTSQTKDDA